MRKGTGDVVVSSMPCQSDMDGRRKIGKGCSGVGKGVSYVVSLRKMNRMTLGLWAGQDPAAGTSSRPMSTAAFASRMVMG